ncbi:unnamed protein product [Oikopleura dioica]|uniref:Uncharacterized protein n=1 Tax=Oikopleura dioica TaxID=34765 RepID=E4Y582_OIKDI|nr:unnamed protein product [Oikopleura dioica]
MKIATWDFSPRLLKVQPGESILKSHLEEERNGIHCARKRSFAARSYEPASCLSNSSFRACFPADSSQGSKTNALPKSCTRF